MRGCAGIRVGGGISHWVEMATYVAVRLNGNKLPYLFCYGADDLYCLVARPTSYFKSAQLIETFHSRIATKHWQARWPDLRVVLD